MIQVGDPFPEFSLPNQDGETVTNEDFKGKKTVVYFYPKDDTPGCTAEACEFRDVSAKLEGVNVVGVSPDTPRSHVKFIGKFNLNFPLLADVDHKLADACGAWVQKMNYDRPYMGVERSTFLLDEKGIVTKIWRKVRAQGHAGDVAATLA